MELWYDRAAVSFEEALPLGNGRMGAMVYGGVAMETIKLNDDTMWYGGPRNRVNPCALEALPRVRALIEDGRVREAQELCVDAMAALPESMRHFEPLCDAEIRLPKGEASQYRRALDIASGIASVSYVQNGAQCAREAFVSYPAQVMALRLSAVAENAADAHGRVKPRLPRLSLDARLKRGRYYDTAGALDGRTVYIAGASGGDGVRFACALRVVAAGVRTTGETVSLRDAESAVLLIAGATSYRADDPLADAVARLDAAEGKGYDALRREHAEDFSRLMDRVSIAFEGNDRGDLPTNERVARAGTGAADHALYALYFQYARYLMVSGSRPGCAPLNLQGVWNDKFLPPWDSKYTININTQMNYWPAETCALPECHLPLIDHIERMRPSGRAVAGDMYGARGFVAHHNTDIWGDCAPQDRNASSTMWPMGAAWLCLHIWEHYLFTRDRRFLEEHYPALREAAEFFEDFLIEDDKKNLVTSPSISPENTYIAEDGQAAAICAAPAMDSQILYELFTAVCAAAGELDTDAQFAERVRMMRARLTPIGIGKYGQIMEWRHDVDEAEPAHRHLSHLFALYPGYQLGEDARLKLRQAAKTSLDLRVNAGGGSTGWSRAWLINLYARLREGEKAGRSLQTLLSEYTLPNLFNTHPPFQIDGNFGGAAGIAEMLVQSSDGYIAFAPAIPSLLKAGRVEGLRARGGFIVGMTWDERRMTSASVCATMDGPCAALVPYGKTVMLPGGGTAQGMGEIFKYHMKKGDKLLIK